jgi:antitoxin component YwqK of YwqJK toxin-antitoxin module
MIGPAMFKQILCAGLLYLFLPTLKAQHTDKILNETHYSLMHTGLDEKNVPDFSDKSKLSKKMLKSLPDMNGKSVVLSDTKKNRKSGMIIAEEAGRELFSTEYKRDNLHGLWLSRYPDNQLVDSGRFQHNIPDGEWHSWYPNGQIRSIRTYNADKWNAVYSEVNRRNTKIYYHNLSRLVNWDSRHYQTLTDGVASFASLPADVKKYKPPFKFCLHEGLFMNYYPNGMVKDSGYYKDGLRDGIWNEYYTNGVLSATGFYLNGLRNGGWKYYSREGKLTVLAEYKKGKLLHRKSYYDQPTIHSK